jgi:hypothetical protein
MEAPKEMIRKKNKAGSEIMRGLDGNGIVLFDLFACLKINEAYQI